ncbi:glycoside hydrolase domain-containing protein [Micromonospora sp. NPDC048839]|uniref:glycoside hydrolase domain-containing protein n=1 Tax=Micromonospora sp. NPDC048839 TaxID=3155641 RepID=UPI0033DB3D0F
MRVSSAPHLSNQISRRGVLAGLAAIAAGGVTGLAFGSPAAAAALRRGVDYSWGRPSISALQAGGYTFACRYLSDSTTGKNLTRSEADALIAGGIDIVSNWEYTASEALQGYAKGVENATKAHSQALACGMPAGRPIYLSVDFDASASQQPVINAYFDGAASVLGRARVGAYGGYYVIKRLFDAGKIRWGWQTYAWSSGQWDSRAQLRQVENGVSIGGADCDRNEAWAIDFGQWGTRRPAARSLTVALNADGRLQAFQTRGSGAVYSTWQTSANGVFGDWANLGGNDLQAPTAVTKPNGRIELLAIGGDSKLYDKWQTTANGPFADWAGLGGTDLTTDLTTATNADGRLQVFVIGGNGSLYSVWQTTTSGPWSAWANLGGSDLRSLSAVKKKDGRIELFAIGGDGKLYHKWQNTANGPFADWTSLGGNDLTTDLTIAANADGRLQAFVIGGNGALYSIWQTTTSGPWSAWTNLDGTDLHAIKAVTKTDGRIELFAIGGDGKLYHKWQNTANGPFADWTSLGGNGLTTDLAVATNADGRLQVFVGGGNGSLYSMWQTTTSGPWSTWANLG